MDFNIKKQRRKNDLKQKVLKKILKLLTLVMFPVVTFLSLGIFFTSGIVSGYASAMTQNGGGFFVGNNSTITIETDSAISGFTALNGGGVFVSSGGTFIMNGGSISENSSECGGGVHVSNGGTFTLNGGTISENTASSGNGANIYNAGTLTINSGVVGETETSIETESEIVNGIYNSGTMNVLGGEIHDNIYVSAKDEVTGENNTTGTLEISDGTVNGNIIGSSGSTIKLYGGSLNGTITTEGNVIIGKDFSYSGTINLGITGTIIFEDYDGTTPNFDIVVSNERGEGEIVYLEEYSTTTNGVEEKITGFDTSRYLRLKATVDSFDEKTIISLVQATATVKIVGQGYSVSGTGIMTLTWDEKKYSPGTYLIPVGTTINVSQTAGSYRTGGIEMSGGKGTFSNGSYTILEEDVGQTITFTATWKTYYVDAIAVIDGTRDSSIKFFTVDGSSDTKSFSYSGYKTIDGGTTYKTYQFTAVDLDGYVFLGWYLDSTCSSLKSKNKTITTDDVFTLEANKTYYACYITPVIATFNANGGTFSDGSSIQTKSVVSGATIGTLPTPARSGYEFKGWYTESTGGNKIESSTTMTADTTYYARWKDSSIVQVSLVSDITYSIYYKYGTNKYYSNESLSTEITKIGYIPEKQYCVFSGYYSSSTGGTQYISSSGAFVNNLYNTISSDCTLYAQYTQVITRVNENGIESSTGGYVKIGTYNGSLRWKILAEEKYNGYALVVLDKSIGNNQFYINSLNRTHNGKTICPNNYEYSNIRSWLNGYTDTTYGGYPAYATTGFYVKAFNSNEKKFITTTYVLNGANTTGDSSNSFVCGNTVDRIFLLSYQEANKLLDISERKGYGCEWMLRSPYSGRQDSIYFVGSTGGITSMQLESNSSVNYGTVPAITIKWNMNTSDKNYSWEITSSSFTSSQKNEDESEDKILSIERTFSISSENTRTFLFDDKKKYSTEVVLEEKRYTNDVIQLPKVVG